MRATSIERIAARGTQTEPAQVSIIDGGGPVLMPDLIDAHWQAAFTTLPALSP